MFKTSFQVVKATLRAEKKRLLLFSGVSAAVIFAVSCLLSGNLHSALENSIIYHYERAFLLSIFLGYIAFAVMVNLIIFNTYQNEVRQHNVKKYRVIVLRIVPLYSINLISGILFLLPSFLIFLLYTSVTAAVLIFCLYSLFALPLTVTALSCLVTALLCVLERRKRILCGIRTGYIVLFLLCTVLINFAVKYNWLNIVYSDKWYDFTHNTRPLCFYLNTLYMPLYNRTVFVGFTTDFIHMGHFVLTSAVMLIAAAFVSIVADSVQHMTRADFNIIKQMLKINLQSMAASTLSFISGKKDWRKLNGSAFATVITIVLIFFVLALLSFFFGVFSVLALSVGKAAEVYFFAVFFGSVIFSIMGSIFASQSYLFEAKDNELLLSMPVSPIVILLSRTATLYTLNFLYSIMVTLPSLLAYIVFIGISPVGFVFYVLSLGAIPILITAVGCIVGYALWKIASKVPKKNAFSNLFGMISLLSISVIWLLIDNSQWTLAEVVSGIVFAVEHCLSLVRWYAQAVSNGNLFSMLLFFSGCTISLVPVLIFIAKRFIIIITTKENVRKRVYVRKPMRKHSLFAALLKKEVLYFFKLPGYVLNSGMGSIMMVIMGLFLVFKGINVPQDVYEYLPNFDDVIKISIVSAISLMAVMNDVSAPSISLEGKTLWILQSAPIDCMTIFLAKAMVAPVITLPGIIFLTVMSVIQFNVTAVDVLFIFLIPTMASFFSGILGVLINLRFPRFDWSAEIIVIKQSGSVLLTLLGSIFITGFPFIFAVIFPALISDFNILISYMICFVYLLGVIVGCWFILKFKGRKLYENL